MANRIAVELDLNLKHAEQQMSEFKETGMKLGLDEKDLKKVSDLERKVQELSKSLQGLVNSTNNKVNTKQFTDATKRIQGAIDKLQQNFDSLVAKLPEIAKAQLSQSFEGAIGAVKDLNTQVNNTVTAVKTASQMFDKLEIVNANDKKKYEEQNKILKDRKKIYEDLLKLEDKVTNPSISRTVDEKDVEGKLQYAKELQKEIQKLYFEYQALDKKIISIDYNAPDFDEKEYTNIQKSIINIISTIQENIKQIDELSDENLRKKGIGLNLIKIDGNSLKTIKDDLHDRYSDIFDEIRADNDRLQTEINNTTELLRQLGNLSIEEAEATKDSNVIGKAKKERTNKGIAVPLYVSTSTETFKKQVKAVLDVTQQAIAKEPIEVQLKLSSKYTDNKYSKMMKQAALDLQNINDADVRERFAETLLNIQKQLEKEATIHIKSDVSDAEFEIRKVLGRIRKELNKRENKLHVSPDVTIPKSKVKQIQTELNTLAKELTLKLDHVVISDKAIQQALSDKNKKDKLIDAKAIANTATLASLIDKIVNSNQEFVTSDQNIKESLLEIKSVIETISVDSIVNPLKDLVYILSNFTGVISKTELDQMFDGMKADVEDITGSLRESTKNKPNPNRDAIEQVLEEYKRYRLAGGNKDISELGGEKNVQNWLKKNFVEETSFTPNLDINYNNIVDQASKNGVEAGKNFSNEYAQGIREGIPEVENAARELVDAAINSLNKTQGTENGNNYGDGYSEGIKDTEAKAENAGADLAEAARKGTVEAQDSHSPSKVAEKLGEYWGEGYANGILNTSAKIKNAIRALVEEGRLTLKDLSKDTVHTNESDIIYNDIISGENPNNYAKSYQKYIESANKSDILSDSENVNKLVETYSKAIQEATNLKALLETQEDMGIPTMDIDKLRKDSQDAEKIVYQLRDKITDIAEVEIKSITHMVDSLDLKSIPTEKLKELYSKLVSFDNAEVLGSQGYVTKQLLGHELASRKYNLPSSISQESKDAKKELSQFLDEIPVINDVVYKGIKDSINILGNQVKEGTLTAEQALEQLEKKMFEVIESINEFEQLDPNSTFTHIGSSFLDKNKFEKISNNVKGYEKGQFNDPTNRNKPYNGLWAIPTGEEFEWETIAEEMNKSAEYLAQRFTFKFKKDAKVLIIKSFEDIQNLPRIKEYTGFDKDLKLKQITNGKGHNGEILPDWETIGKYYDGIMVLDDALAKLTTWDINSVVVTNPDAIEQIQLETSATLEDVQAQKELAKIKEETSKINETPVSSEVNDEVKTFLNSIELLKGSKVYDGIENVEERIQHYVEGIKSGLIDAEDALQDFVNHSTFDPDINATQEADKVVKAEDKKQKAKKDTKKATEDTITTQQKEKTELEDTSAIDKYQAELNQSERSLLDFTGALGENSLAITEQEKLLAQLTKGKAFPDTAYQGLFRMSNGKDESKKAIANELLGLYTDFGNFLDTDTLNEIWSKTKNSDLSKKMKNSIMKYISKIAKELKEGLEQGVQEASTELQSKKTKTITMSKSEYKDYVKKNKLVPLGKNGEAFEHNFEMQLRGLQEKGLATQKINKNGNKGRWIIQVEVEDNGELEDINKQIEDTKSKTKDLSKTQKTIKDTSKAIKQLSNETEELTKEEQEYLNQQEKKRLDSEQNIGTTLTEIEKTKEATKVKREQAKAEKELANAKEKSNTINKKSDISPVRQAGRNIGSELAEGIRDTVEQVKESAELSKIIKETGEQAESASKGKDRFTESNKQVKESAENSINSLSEEAKLFKEIGDNSKEAAKGKTEFTKSNKDVKKSADNTASFKSKEKDKEEYDVKEAKKRQKEIEKIVSKTQSELNEGVVASVDRSYDSHGYLVQALIRLEKAVQEDENLVKRIERINVRYDKDGGVAYTSTQTSDDLMYGDKVEEKRAKAEEKIRKEREKQELKDIEAQNQARIDLTNKMADGRIKAEINAQKREYEAERKQAEAINKSLRDDWEHEQRELANAMAKGREKAQKDREKAESEAIKQNEKEQKSDLKLNDDLEYAQAQMTTLKSTLESQGRYVGELKTNYDELAESLGKIYTPEQLSHWKNMLNIFKEIDKQNKIEDISNKTPTKYVDSKVKELENIQKNLQNLVEKNEVYKDFYKGLDVTFISSDGIDKAIVKISEIQNKIKSLKEKNDLDFVNNEEKKELDIIIQQYKEYAKLIEKNEKIANENSRVKLLKKITDALKDNTKYSRKAKVELDEYRNLLKNTALTSSELSKIGSEFLKIQEAEKDAGREGDNFFIKVIKRASNMSASFLGMYLSLYDIIRYIRTATSTINELDTALVDLRKTTSMSNSELEDFYFNATNLAKEMGVTTSEIINQAAAWSRLGYSSKEASETMAVLSSQFASISPGMSTEEAQEGLVSTMKAFGIEVENTERTIMDNINKIGNTMALTNTDVIDMLERSSSAMSAANNSLEQTIALESAAMEITQNAEMTGTAFKTISMRIRGKLITLPPYMETYMLCA